MSNQSRRPAGIPTGGQFAPANRPEASGQALVDDEGPSAMVELPDGTREWYRDGQRHRDDGPAIERPDGTREWYRDGQRHRDDGPAIESPSGYREWRRDGQLHRDDGPAIEEPNGFVAWYRNGERIEAPK